MNDLTQSPQTVPAGTPQVAATDAPIPEVTSTTGMGGAQDVKPAPPGTIPMPITPSARPDSAMSKLKEKLRSRANPEVKPAAKQEPEVKPAAAEPEAGEPEPGEKPETDEDDPMGDTPAVDDKKAKTTPEDKTPASGNSQEAQKKEKVNPWKLVDEHKAARAKLEQELSEARKLVPNKEAREKEIKEIEEVKKRNEELEKHIRFTDYQQSAEYKEKYEKPYERQWVSSMKELKGIEVDDGNGGVRQISPTDMLELVNLPLTKARAIANERFGDYANDVIEHRGKIRELFDQRSEALEKAKTEGVEVARKQQEMEQREYAENSRMMKEVYEKATQSILEDPRHSYHISKRDGDDEGNAMLEKGYALVDRAFSLNPNQKGLSAEERAAIVKQHAAVRHKAAAYSRNVRDNVRLRAENEQLKKELNEFRSTQPSFAPASTSKTSTTTQAGSKMDQMRARLRAKAQPART